MAADRENCPSEGSRLGAARRVHSARENCHGVKRPGGEEVSSCPEDLIIAIGEGASLGIGVGMDVVTAWVPNNASPACATTVVAAMNCEPIQGRRALPSSPKGASHGHLVRLEAYVACSTSASDADTARARAAKSPR